VWVLRLYRFSACFPYKLVISFLLYEKAELLPVAPKKKILLRFSESDMAQHCRLQLNNISELKAGDTGVKS
jgi:hypothetical protein